MSKYFSSNQTSDSLPYDNTTSGLTAENAKDAIDELSSEKLDKADNLLVNPQVVRVKISNAGAGEFTDLALAVASITDADPVTKPYVIEMGAGNFSVNNPIVLPAGVSLRGEGINVTSISPIDANQHLLILGTLSEVSFLNLKGITGSVGSGKAAIYCEDIGNFGQLHKLSIYDFDIPIDNYANTGDSTVYVEYVDINGDFSFGSRTRSNAGFLATTQLENFYSYESAGTTPTHVYIAGVGSSLVLNSAGISGSTSNDGISVADGASVSLSDTLIKGFNTGFISENVGVGPSIDLSGITFSNNVNDVAIDNPNTIGAMNITADKTKVTVDDLAEITVFIADTQVGGVTFTGELNYSSTDFSKIADIGPLVSTSSTMGVFTGGELSVGSGLTLTVSALKGYISTGLPPSDIIKYYQLASQTISVSPSSNNYIYINSSGILVQNATTPDTRENILLGRAITNATAILFVEKASLDSQHYSNKIDRVFRDAIGSIYVDGSLVSENGTRGLDATSGRYYYSETEFLPAGGIGISWSSFYRSASPGVYTEIPSVTTVDKDFYDDGSGTLASIPSGKHVKHLLLTIGGPSEKYILVYGTVYYNTLTEAQTAPLPTVPSYMTGSFVRVASIIISPNTTNIADIIDERPRIGFASSSSVGGVTDHGSLSGLGDNDHDQYLLRSGLNVMVGNLDMGGNSISNVNLVDSVDVTAHASRHAFNGLDPFLSATPQTVGTANAEGTSNTQFSRADHVHAHGNQTGPTQHAVATTGANGFMSSTDKTKLDGIATGATANSTDAALRDRATHTGTQLASTISNFASTVLATALTGVSFLTNSAILATDSILVAFGKIQAQLNGHINVGGSVHPNATTSVAGFMSATDKTKLDAIGGNRIIKSGVVAAVSFTGAPRTATVTFGTAMPSTNYSIAISGANSRSWSYQTKTVNGFVINANANASLSGEVTWTCISHGESVE